VVERFREGLTLFNSGAFYEAHEALEDVWRGSEGEEKRFLQALVQVAVALHHHSTGNLVGARSVLARARETLAQFPDAYCGLQVGELRHSLQVCNEALATGRPVPVAPRLRAVAD
jgi:predicted metal-dependent hydrolase